MVIDKKEVLGAVIGGGATIFAALISAIVVMSQPKASTFQCTASSGTNVCGSGKVTLNQTASSHSLPWTDDAFAESVRNGNLGAISEYLKPSDGFDPFDPNALYGANDDKPYVLDLPIYNGTNDFPQIVRLFKNTGKLNWRAVNNSSSYKIEYGHPITMQWELFNEAASHHYSEDVKALVDAGADPAEFIKDTFNKLQRSSHEGQNKGILSGQLRDADGAELEQTLATFKAAGYRLPYLDFGSVAADSQRALTNARSKAENCKTDIRTHHSVSELMKLATDPATLDQISMQPFQSAAAHLNGRLMLGGWKGDQVEYNDAISAACGD